MPKPSLTIWTNYHFPPLPPAADAIFLQGIRPHRLVRSSAMQASNLVAGAADPAMAEADIVYGQPDPAAVIASGRVKWIELTSAGYDRYDRADLRTALQARGGMLTNASGVYEEPCAEHVFAMMLSLARQLPQQLDDQWKRRSWDSADHRIRSFLLTGQTVVILSHGTIARRLIELLAPFRMKIITIRRAVRGDEPVETVSEKDAASVLPRADHVINILPGGESTKHFMNAPLFAAMKPGAIFYNIGRGGTVDQAALLAALDGGRLRYAYLDVTDPEPLPPDHPLWKHPNCFITPHTAGGSVDEFERLANHFIYNLRLFETGQPLANRVM
jgi:phosphoglycerate dehydrogenase-like enzyme